MVYELPITKYMGKNYYLDDRLKQLRGVDDPNDCVDYESLEDIIPGLYETEDVSFDEKVIFQIWSVPLTNCYWFIAEIDQSEDLAFGYANLGDDEMAEWGYISLKELRDVGAVKVSGITPSRFRDVKKLIDEVPF